MSYFFTIFGEILESQFMMDKRYHIIFLLCLILMAYSCSKPENPEINNPTPEQNEKPNDSEEESDNSEVEPDNPEEVPGDSEEDTDKESGDQNEENQDSEQKNNEFVMLFTNDFHSQIEPMDGGDGGVLRLQALVDSVRRAEPHVLLADAGDLVQGTYYFSLLNGVVEMKMLEMLKYDIRTIGNHEFDKKVVGLGEMLALSKVPVVCSNYDFSNTNIAHYFEPSKILEAGNIKVGFVGLNVRLQNLVNKTACEGVEWQNAIDVADKYAEELRNRGADIVIGLSHLGYEADSDAYYYDKGLVKRTKHIDMIIGGHSHTTLKKAVYVTDANGDEVPIVQTGSKGLNLGYAKIKLDKNGKPSFSYRLIPVNDRLDDRIDASFSGIIEDYAADVEEQMNVKLGYAPYYINRGTPESALGNLTADGLIWMAKEFHDVTADVAVYNSGGVRANISKGDVTLGDVYAVYPFDNVLSLITIKGSKLKALLNKVPGSLYVNAGVKIVKSGNSITTMTVGGKTINDNQNYTVATIDYISDNDAYTSIFNGYSNREDSVEMIRDYFGEYFKYLASKNNGKITASEDGRVTVDSKEI